MSEMVGFVSGPMFEPANSELFQSSFGRQGAHYNIYSFDSMDALRRIFPEGKANEFNVAVFSTSGVHGTYATIEEIEASLRKYGQKAFDDWPDEGSPDDWTPPELTVLIIHPRIVCLRYGVVTVSLDDLPWLKGLRDSSWTEMAKIGAGSQDSAPPCK